MVKDYRKAPKPRKAQTRGDVIDRAFKMCVLALSQKEFGYEDVCRELDIAYCNCHRYVTAASLYLPIVQTKETPPFRFKLMEVKCSE